MIDLKMIDNLREAADLTNQDVIALAAERDALKQKIIELTAPVREPKNFIQLTRRTFAGLEGWDPVEQKYPLISLGMDGSEPLSPPTVATFTYPEGFQSGGAPGTMQYGAGKWKGITEWFHRFSFKYSENWSGNESRTNKLCYFWLSNTASCILPRVRGSFSSPLIFNIGLQGTADPRQLTAANGDTGLQPNMGLSGEIVRGPWQTIETRYKLNTPGVANGEVDCWLNGNQIMRYRDWRCRDDALVTGSSLYELYQGQITPVFGGGGKPVPWTQALTFGEFYISAP